MTRRRYRRVARALFLLLFVVFVVFYILLSNQIIGPKAGGGWGTRENLKDLGIVTISNVESGGFSIDDFTFDTATSLSNDDTFDQSLRAYSAHVMNTSSSAVHVKLRVGGTSISDISLTNAGLNALVYYYPVGEEDPIGADVQSYLQENKGSLVAGTVEEYGMVVYNDPTLYPLEFYLDGNEELNLMLVFWVDYDQALQKEPSLSDIVQSIGEKINDEGFNARYHITLKMTSRAKV